MFATAKDFARRPGDGRAGGVTSNFDAQLAVLDVGSNRGSFVRVFLDAAPNANIVAVEPDERVVRPSPSLERAPK